jgi:chitin synthase
MGGMTGYPPPGYQSGRNTPIGGMMPHAPPSRQVSNYFDLPMPMTTESPSHGGFDLGGLGGSASPSDAEIERAVREVLANADLNTVTKKNVRHRLEEMFGLDLSHRKAAINSAIDAVLVTKS